MSKLQVKRECCCLTVNTKTLNCKVEYGGKCYKSDGRGSYINFYRKIGKKYIPIAKKFSFANVKASRIEKTADYTAIICVFSGFRVLGKKYDVTFMLEYRLYDDGKLDFVLSADGEVENRLHSVLWPRALNGNKREKSAYSVNSYRQGCLTMDGEGKLLDKFLMTTFPRNVNTGDCYMPLYGRVIDGMGFCSYVDDANDCAIFSSFGKGLSVLSAPMFFASLGKLSYTRIVHTHFYDECDYNTFAKEYRKFLIDGNKLVTIDDKIKSNNNVAKLIGTPVIHTNIYSHIQPESSFYKEGQSEKLYATFDERAAAFTKFKELGLNRAYIHLDGWGELGYDNLHPYVFPPCPKAGGADGMRRLADTADKIGYIFGLHDQYRDFYTRSKVYDADKAVKRIDGTSYLCKTWQGGAHNWLCASFAPEYVERTYKELDELGIKVKGTYLDVFAIVLGDECFSKDHRVTRTESIEYRTKCFDLLRKKGLIVCSEEPGCLMINAIDMVHHAPYNVMPQDGGRSLGISVPLFNLVYHDCVFVPWGNDGLSGWGIPEGESGEVHCALNAGSPYFNGFEGSHMETTGGILPDAEVRKRIEKVNKLCDIQSRLYNKEMVKHEFLSLDKKTQRCTYSDGTVITADFKKNVYNVEYANANVDKNVALGEVKNAKE